jgi:heat shock protein HtpX
MGLIDTIKLSTLFAVLIALFGGIGFFFMGMDGLILGLIVAGIMNIGSYFYSDKLVVKMHRAKPLSEEDHPELHRTVEELAEKAGVPKPDLYIMNTDTPNAFATGRNPKHSIVCVTSGLLTKLNSDEVEGVLAHEIAHVKNRDTLIQAVAGTLAGAISIIAQMMFFSSFGRENRNPALLVAGIIIAPLAASMVKMTISRSREFTADATAANYTDPGYLASALQSIESSVARNPLKNGPRGTSHMFIINPFRQDRLAKLFSTHPPTEERIQRLQELRS